MNAVSTNTRIEGERLAWANARVAGAQSSSLRDGIVKQEPDAIPMHYSKYGILFWVPSLT